MKKHFFTRILLIAVFSAAVAGAFIYSSASIKAEASLKGDINGDGEVSSSDLGLLINMITGSVAETSQADLNSDGVVNSADLGAVVNIIVGIGTGSSDPECPAEAVDLGLSVKWASCNLGATAPEESGDYFAWGEIATKSEYTADNCLWHNVPTKTLIAEGVIDANGNLTAKYDAATAGWGESWRLPTKDEITELNNSCTWTWTTQGGVNGYLVTGPNGNSIFLSAAGFRMDSSIQSEGMMGFYRTATAWLGFGDVYSLSINSSRHSFSAGARYLGCPIRPVKN